MKIYPTKTRDNIVPLLRSLSSLPFLINVLSLQWGELKMLFDQIVRTLGPLYWPIQLAGFSKRSCARYVPRIRHDFRNLSVTDNFIRIRLTPNRVCQAVSFISITLSEVADRLSNSEGLKRLWVEIKFQQTGRIRWLRYDQLIAWLRFHPNL